MIDSRLSLQTAISLTPLRAGLSANQTNIVDVLVRIQAPDAVEVPGSAARVPQAIALVIDRSGSMHGGPLEEAKRCAGYVVGKMRPADSASLVEFDSRVRRLWPAVPIGDGVALRAAIASIDCGGHTNLHGGWKEGADSLEDVAGQGLKRVILLSDGQANQGLTDLDAIAAQCAEWAAQGITTSTYGLGRRFNEDLMVAMARSGGGNHYYGDTAEDLMEPFEQELELLGNLCMRNLRLSASALEGVTVQVANQLPEVDGGWRLPDLAWGAEAWAVLRLTVPAEVLPSPGNLLSILQVAVSGQSLEGAAVTLERVSLALQVMSSATFAKLSDDPLVARRLVELAAADALGAMRKAASAHDWDLVDRLLDEASRRLADNEWVASILASMRTIAAGREADLAMKEMLYSSTKLRSRLSAKNESMELNAPNVMDEAAYLRRKPAQGKGRPS